MAYDDGQNGTHLDRDHWTAMELSNEYRRIQSQPEALPLVLEILMEQSAFADRDEFLQFAFARITNAVSARYVGLARAVQGAWRVEPTDRSSSDTLPEALLADVLDDEQPRVQDGWAAAPLLTRSHVSEILVIRLAPMAGGLDPHSLDAVAATMGLALRQVQNRQRSQRRTRRLETILEIAGQWNQHLEPESLLVQMAEASTRLLQTERASIFLWDRPRRQLVGRPALGVEGDELRIPDDTGIVGRVVQSGEVCRVYDDEPSNAINRDVDNKLGFQTRNLLCAPLRGRDGQVLGAFEMINKLEGNFTDEDEAGLIELASHAAIALENTQAYGELIKSRKRLADQAADDVQMIGETQVIRNLRNTIERVAPTDLALLVLGENGTGKEVVSRLVHFLSNRRDEPFVAVNCAAIAETLLESELFGHERGAFTDAHEARAGKFELASGGTLFLDEIGDLSAAGQAKLLRVLEEKVVVRVGGSLTIPTDVRVIAATNQDLAEMVRERKFREDLFFRLNVVTIEMPPLRERVDDVILLAKHFLADFCARARRAMPDISPEAEKRLRQHAWPGNVRELRNLMERLAYLSAGDTIEAEDLAFIIAPGKDDLSMLSMDLTLTDATRQFQVEYIRKHISASSGNMSEAARSLGLHRSNLYRKMRQLEMTGADEEQDEDDDQ